MNDFKLPSVPASTATLESQSAPQDPPLVYNVPLWSERPPESFRYQLEVILNGSIQTVINLDSKPFYLIGRLDFCDIVIDNDSVSRQHAVIQFRKTGEAYLYDLGSTHGTILNGGAPINPNAYKRIMAGDSIKFGASSRTFVFEGGPDRDEIAADNPVEKLAQQMKTSKASPSEPKPKETHSSIVAPPQKRRFSQVKQLETEEDEMDAEGRLEAQLTRRKGTKSQNEDEEDGGNVSDEERDNAELEMIAGYLGREAIEGADGEDSFFDRTLEKQRESAARAKDERKKQPETYETIIAKLRVLNFVLQSVKERIAVLDGIISKDEQRRGHTDGEEIDSLDAFMNDMSQTVDEEKERDKKRGVARELETEMEGLQRIERELKPKDGEVHVVILSASAVDRISDEYYNDLVERVRKEGGAIKLQMKRAAPPEPKRPKLAEPDLVPASTPFVMPTTSKAEDFKAPVTTVEPIAKSKNPIQDVEFSVPSHPVNPKKRDQPTAKPASKQDNTDDDAYEMWQAPQGQSGDGRTSLNDKYGY